MRTFSIPIGWLRASFTSRRSDFRIGVADPIGFARGAGGEPGPRRGCPRRSGTLAAAAHASILPEPQMGEAQAHRLPNALERATRTWVRRRAVARYRRPHGGTRRRRRRRRPPAHTRRGRVRSLPAGIHRAVGAAGSDPEYETTGVTSGGFRCCRSVDRRGVAPNRTLRPKAESPVREYASEP